MKEKEINFKKEIKKWFEKLPYDETLKVGELKRFIITKNDFKYLNLIIDKLAGDELSGKPIDLSGGR